MIRVFLKEPGLSHEEVRKRLEEHGYNELTEAARVSKRTILARQVRRNFVIYILLAAMTLSLFVGKFVTAYTIVGVVVVVVSVGFVQEYRAERAVKALKQMIVPFTTAVRGGKERKVPSKELVPGDIVLLRSGERVPADCEILEESELRVNEAVLTGESKEVKKSAQGRGENELFMGTFVVHGRCVARVTLTGMDTEFGKIAGMISSAEKELPLQRKINGIAKYMVVVATVMATMSGAIMLSRLPFSYPVFVEVLLVAIASAVSAFPEGFPVVLITNLAMGAHRMAKKNAIVNRMSTIETLGETTVICADKTGTITTGEMTVRKVFSDGEMFDVSGLGYEPKGEIMLDSKAVDPRKVKPLHMLLKCSALCNDSRVEAAPEGMSVVGSPTEAALVVLAGKGGAFKEGATHERMKERPFSSERKMMSVLCSEPTGSFVYVKGAPEVILERCSLVQLGNGLARLDAAQKKKLLNANRSLTRSCYRTLALAYRKADAPGHSGETEQEPRECGLTFLGLVGMEDPPREEVRESLMMCESAGIKVKMITGDHRDTALAVAREIGLKGGVIEGHELDAMDEAQLQEALERTSIFARVRPEHKLRIVRALKRSDEIVTMTGDGVNDSPALKEAHIGVAMGRGGTDVSREAADLTLKDDNFAHIVAAITEGRTIFSNIRKFITYELSCNYAELAVVFVGVLVGMPLPLVALQILFMNLVTDNLPSLSLGFNPPSHDVMRTKPRKGSSLMDRQLLGLLALSGSIMAAGTLGVFWYTLNVLSQDVTVARTAALVTLIIFEIANAFNFRSFRYPVHKLPFFANRYLVFASLASLLATAAIVYTPLSVVFETAPIGLPYWIGALLISLSIVLVFDVMKMARGRRHTAIR